MFAMQFHSSLFVSEILWNAVVYVICRHYQNLPGKLGRHKNKTFLFFKIESGNFQYLLEKWFFETSRDHIISINSPHSENSYFHACQIDLKFCEVLKTGRIKKVTIYFPIFFLKKNQKICYSFICILLHEKNL